MKKIVQCTFVLMGLCVNTFAQTQLTLHQCRQMAIQNNKDIEIASAKIKMAEYDKKIAEANYLPNISFTGSYMYNQKSIALINDKTSNTLQNLGTMLNGVKAQTIQGLEGVISANPAIAKQYMSNPLWQTVIGAMSKADMSAMVNTLGNEIDKALHPNIHNVIVGVVSVQQPLFVGGKIINANKIAKLAEGLSKAQYDQKYQETLLTVDQTYWQIVSIANKLRLAESYSNLLHKLQDDVNISVQEGVMTEADLLQVKVQTNEADMLKSQAVNGLTLAKMLLCKQIGLELNTPIVLADENKQYIETPTLMANKPMEQIYNDRPEIKSLTLANKIYTNKINIARADMLPKVALTANYIVSNPNSYNGFQNKFGAMFNAGVMVNIPIFHGLESYYKTRKAKTEASLYKIELENAKNLINLQVVQLKKQQEEALEHLATARSNMANAEENLRCATIGFESGVITASTALAAHTAWLKAHSELIDAGIALQINNANLLKAEGEYK